MAILILLASGIASAPFEPSVRVSDPSPDGPRANPSAAAGSDAVYVAWQRQNVADGHDIVVSRSVDGGSWLPEVRVDDLANDSLQQFPELAARGDRVYAAWQDSRNGLDDDDIYFDQGIAGASWGTDVRVNDDIGGPRQLRPSLAVAANGSLYVAYTSAPVLDDGVQIRLVASHDGGITWGPSVLVNATLLFHRGDPRVAVAPNGTVYVAWWDGRAGPYTDTSGMPLEDTDVYVASSTDGGRVFTGAVRVNTPASERRQTSPDLVIGGDGTVFVTWEDERYNAYGVFDIFFAKSADGRTFGGEMAVNDTSPLSSAPKRTSHLSPSIAWSNATGGLYISWIDDRGDRLGVANHNVYVASSADGGASWGPFNRGPSDATHFFDDLATYNGIRDLSEATLISADDRLDPGLLDGSGVDRVVSPGDANLLVDTTSATGMRLRYADTDASLNFTAGEPLVYEPPELWFPQIPLTGFLPATNLSVSDRDITFLLEADFGADRAIDIEPNGTLAAGPWATATSFAIDLSVRGLASTDPIAAAGLDIRYRTGPGYSGGERLNGSAGGPLPLLVLADTGGAYVNVSVDLVALGVDTVDELRYLNVTYHNDDAANVTFDEIVMNVTRGGLGRFDLLDALAAGTAPALGTALFALAAADRIVFMDADLDGRYDPGEPVLRSPAAAVAGMDLTAAFEVLTPASGSWKAFLNPFPVNDDLGSAPQFSPELVVSSSGHLIALWQDYRNRPGTPWPDIRSARARISSTGDITAPNVTHAPPVDNLRAGIAYNFTVTAIDDTGVTAVTILLREPGSSFAQPHPMTRVPGNDTWYYEYTPPRDEGVVSYRFEAEDAAGNVGREPANPIAMHQVFIKNSGREAVGALVLLVAFFIVFLPFLYFLRRATKRENEDRDAAKPADPPQKKPE